MNDLIIELEIFRKDRGLSKTALAKILRANSPQQYTNWVRRGSLPKEYYLRTQKLLGISDPVRTEDMTEDELIELVENTEISEMGKLRLVRFLLD